MGNVKYLLDTHTLLWAVRDEIKLGKNTLAILENMDNFIYISAVSAYEIMYKHQLGKLPQYEYFAENYFEIINKLSVNELPLNMKHTHFAGKLQWAHRDPFDRLLAAQAVVDNLILLTNDAVFNEWPYVNTMW